MKAAEFARTHSCDPDWIAIMGQAEVQLLKPGQTGTYVGLPATVSRHYHNGMYEIHVPGGLTCVSGSEFVADQDVLVSAPMSIVEDHRDKVAQIAILLEELECQLTKEDSPVESWDIRPMEEIAEINPRRPRELSQLPDSHAVTFVPMAAVNQITGQIDGAEVRPFGDIRKGFTYFAEGDVIFAKITPCMQNGKSAVARNLSNALGLGSTEFHVIRPNLYLVIPEWLWHFVRQGSFRREGTHHFRGAVGQQRVPPEYLGVAKIPLPSTEEQKRVVGRIETCLDQVRQIEFLQGELVGKEVHLEPLREAILRKAFAGEL